MDQFMCLLGAVRMSRSLSLLTPRALLPRQAALVEKAWGVGVLAAAKAAGAAVTEAGVPARAPLEALRADQDLSMSLSLSQNSSAKVLHQHSCRLRKNEDSLLRGI